MSLNSSAPVNLIEWRWLGIGNYQCWEFEVNPVRNNFRANSGVDFFIGGNSIPIANNFGLDTSENFKGCRPRNEWKFKLNIRNHNGWMKIGKLGARDAPRTFKLFDKWHAVSDKRKTIFGTHFEQVEVGQTLKIAGGPRLGGGGLRNIARIVGVTTSGTGHWRRSRQSGFAMIVFLLVVVRTSVRHAEH